MGRKDNYWHTGQPGPAGPCSEIYVDRGPEHGRDGGPVADEDRYLEIWNLVFMQEAIDSVRSKEDFRVVADLPSKNIDTGMGLERVAYLLQGVDNLYEIDEVYPVLARASEIVRARYGADHEDDVRLTRRRRPRAQRHSCSSARASHPRTSPAATSCGGCYAAACGPCGCSGSSDPVLPELLPVSMAAMKRLIP